MTTHYMDEAEFCDRIAIMDRGEIVVLDTPEALKASVGADRVRIQTDDDDAAIAALGERFGVEATVSEGAVTFFVPAGEEFVPRLFAELGVRDPLGQRLAADARRRLHELHRLDDPRRRDRRRRPQRNRIMMQVMTGAAGDDRRDRRRPRQRPAAQLAQRAARDQDRLAARADPLPQRPPADRHLARAAAAVPVRARRRAQPALAREHPRRRPEDVHLPRHPLHRRHVHRDVLGRLDRLGPRVRLPAGDDGRAGAAQLDRDRQVPRRRDGRELPGRDPDRARRRRARALRPGAAPRHLRPAAAAGVQRSPRSA